jgi:glycerate 2-kinase
MHVVAAPDKFKGTATAGAVASAIARAAAAEGATCDEVPVADGGEGFLDALGGANRQTMVAGPLGDPVEAGWRLDRGRAVIEMASASGLALVGGADGNDPMSASTYGTGELISTAVESGARRVLVGVGGSATTDGGLGALRALYPPHRLKGIELIVACDVRTRFVDAATVFASQKGASERQVELLRRRLERLVQVYESDYGIDVSELEGGGAAGGLAGGLAAIGAELWMGFDLVAEELALVDRIEGADLVVTGEGFLDAESFNGKVVGGVVELAAASGVPVLAVVGEVVDEVDGPLGDHLHVVSLSERFGRERSMDEPSACVEEAVRQALAARSA